MKKPACVIVFAFALTVYAAAQGVSVAYLEGQVLSRRGADWIEVSVGDRLAPDARIRVGENGYLELQAAGARTGARIILSEAGIYSLPSLLSAHRTMDAAKVGASLSTALVRLVKGSTLKQSAVMGVLGRRMPGRDDDRRQIQAERDSESMRRAEVEGSRESAIASAAPPADQAAPAASAAPPAEPAPSDQDGSGGAAPVGGEDARYHLGAGKDFISAGEYDRAVDELVQALRVSTPQETPEVRYYLACAKSMNGETRVALKLVEGLEAPSSEDWAFDFAIFKAKLLADANAYNEEIAWLGPWGPALSDDPERAPVYYFLLALGYRGVGDVRAERQNLSRVVSLAGDSELGKSAARLLTLK